MGLFGMNRRLFFGILVAIAVTAGYPYAALVLFRLIGTNTVVLTEHDGVQRTLVSGPAAPRPGWVPVLPGAFTIQAAYWLPSTGREIAGSVDLLTHKSVDDIKRFYLDGLEAAGFDARDIGYGYLNAGAAAFFGVDNELLGYGGKSDLTISVTTNAPSGFLLRPRTVHIQWQRWENDAGRERLRRFGFNVADPPPAK